MGSILSFRVTALPTLQAQSTLMGRPIIMSTYAPTCWEPTNRSRLVVYKIPDTRLQWACIVREADLAPTASDVGVGTNPRLDSLNVHDDDELAGQRLPTPHGTIGASGPNALAAFRAKQRAS